MLPAGMMSSAPSAAGVRAVVDPPGVGGIVLFEGAGGGASDSGGGVVAMGGGCRERVVSLVCGAGGIGAAGWGGVTVGATIGGVGTGFVIAGRAVGRFVGLGGMTSLFCESGFVEMTGTGLVIGGITGGFVAKGAAGETAGGFFTSSGAAGTLVADAVFVFAARTFEADATIVCVRMTFSAPVTVFCDAADRTASRLVTVAISAFVAGVGDEVCAHRPRHVRNRVGRIVFTVIVWLSLRKGLQSRRQRAGPQAFSGNWLQV